MPIIESPVIDGLLAAKDALAKTASNITSAAGMYIETDQRLGDEVNQVQFAAAADDTPADDETGDSPTDEETPSVPSIPAFTIPTADELMQMSGQAAKLSNQLSQHINLFNQGMGQIQQVVQMAQQAQASAAPDEEAAGDEDEAALAGDVAPAGNADETGLAMAGQAAGSVPVESVHAGTGREPGPVGQMV